MFAIIGILGAIVGFVGFIMVLIEAWSDGLLWFLCSLFIPFVVFAYIFTHWARAKKGFMVIVAGLVLQILGLALS